MKNKYQRLTKEEKKQAIKEYQQTEKGHGMMKRLTRLMIIGIIGIIYAIGYFIMEYTNYSLTLADLFLIVPLFLASLFFIIMAYKLKIKNLNNFVLKNKPQKNAKN